MAVELCGTGPEEGVAPRLSDPVLPGLQRSVLAGPPQPEVPDGAGGRKAR